MKDANVFVDVDLTLVDANGQLLDGAREALQRLRDEGCHLFLWSTAGAGYCRKVGDTAVERTDLTNPPLHRQKRHGAALPVAV
jgi:hypothetical protein